MSGGGLISGIAAAVKAVPAAARMMGVEPELAADAARFAAGRQRIAWHSRQTQRTIADALRIEQVGELPFEHIRRYVDDIVTVTEEEIRIAVRRLACEARLVASQAAPSLWPPACCASGASGRGRAGRRPFRR